MADHLEAAMAKLAAAQLRFVVTQASMESKLDAIFLKLPIPLTSHHYQSSSSVQSPPLPPLSRLTVPSCPVPMQQSQSPMSTPPSMSTPQPMLIPFPCPTPMQPSPASLSAPLPMQTVPPCPAPVQPFPAPLPAPLPMPLPTSPISATLVPLFHATSSFVLLLSMAMQ
ncbi:hypothetical protein HKD37_15G042531 [Glycine soja]